MGRPAAAALVAKIPRGSAPVEVRKATSCGIVLSIGSGKSELGRIPTSGFWKETESGVALTACAKGSPPAVCSRAWFEILW